MPSGDIVQVLERGLDSLIREQERCKFAATSRPRPNRRQARGRRYVPAHVKRAVWKRDEGRCTFVSTTGQRCPAGTMLEYDHVDPVALGGKATVEGIRLRCRAHNQYAAECAFGTDFMRNKREGARRARAEVRAAAARRTRLRRVPADGREKTAAAAKPKSWTWFPGYDSSVSAPTRRAGRPRTVTTPFPTPRSKSDCAPRCAS